MLLRGCACVIYLCVVPGPVLYSTRHAHPDGAIPVQQENYGPPERNHPDRIGRMPLPAITGTDTIHRQVQEV